jgi:hypothetical protein
MNSILFNGPIWIVLKLPFNYNWAWLETLEGIESIHTLRIRNYRIVVLNVKGDIIPVKKKNHTRKANR